MRTFLFIIAFPLVVFSQSSFEKGKKAFEGGNFKQAIPLFTRALENEPSDKMTRDYLGQSYARVQRWEKSSEVNKTLVEDYPENAEYHFRYGGALGLVAKEANSFQALSLLRDVKFHLKKAIELDPKHIEARWALLQIYLELPGIVGGSESTSREYAAQLQSISPVDGALAYGYIERELENHDKAEVFYKKAVDLGQSVTTYKELAELYKRTGNEADYFETLEIGIKKLNSIALASAYVESALRLNRNKQKALEILNTLTPAELNPGSEPRSGSSEEIEKLNQLKSKLN
ncbi:tetratricopeptide repeat protein [Psychroflexus sediminis]|uniref:Tetratricopeptide repeat-containing protein n=1 Tax=Psychroflexus sediminis TaxID=470826 RepID=A0A1G7U2U2_9FLAO|nr:tetratricopeptide repeat protein [Psychroflexus sediminis]SDG41581.1 Tetratricopeptide repeat-containing protein [Psychroflexus sediminis]